MSRNRNSNPFRRFAVAALFAAAATPLAAGEWNFSVTPYLWATDVGVDVAIDDRQLIDEEIPVDELLEQIETIAQVRFEAQRGAHGLFVDLFDVTLADDARTIALPSGAGAATLRSEMGLTILDLGVLYDPNGDQEGFQVLYGTRLLDQRAEIEVSVDFAGGDPAERSYDIDDTFADVLVGVRYIRPIGERWSVAARADVSTGGTELTWSANPSVGYSFGENGRYTVFGGYRHMEVDFESDSPVEATMTLSGLYAGMRFTF